LTDMPGECTLNAETIVDHIGELDQRRDRWAVVHFVRDFAPAEVDNMQPGAAAGVLLEFDRVRRRLRSRAPAVAV